MESAKNKFWDEMNEQERRAFIEAVCTRAAEYLVKTQSSTKQFFKYWANEIHKTKRIYDNEWMHNYYYDVIDNQVALSIGTVYDTDGTNTVDVSYNIKEVRLFVLNAVNEVPFHTPIMKAILAGKNKFEIIRDGIEENDYSNAPNLKAGRKPKEESLRQKILRGEITRYEAYDKERKKKQRSK